MESQIRTEEKLRREGIDVLRNRGAQEFPYPLQTNVVPNAASRFDQIVQAVMTNPSLVGYERDQQTVRYFDAFPGNTLRAAGAWRGTDDVLEVSIADSRRRKWLGVYVREDIRHKKATGWINEDYYEHCFPPEVDCEMVTPMQFDWWGPIKLARAYAGRNRPMQEILRLDIKQVLFLIGDVSTPHSFSFNRVKAYLAGGSPNATFVDVEYGTAQKEEISDFLGLTDPIEEHRTTRARYSISRLLEEIRAGQAVNPSCFNLQ